MDELDLNLQEWTANTLKPTDTVTIFSNPPTTFSSIAATFSGTMLMESEKLLLKEMLAKNSHKFAAIVIVGNAPVEEYQELAPGAIVVHSRTEKSSELSDLLSVLMSRELMVPDYSPFSVPVLIIFHYLSREQSTCCSRIS